MTRLNLIGISGKKGAGKDTVGMMIRKATGNRFKLKSYAAKLKEVASVMLDIPAYSFDDREVKNKKLGPEWNHMTVREFLQKLGTDAVRNGLHDETWINLLFKNYNEACSWVITDVRMLNEAHRIHMHGGIIVRVTASWTEEDNHVTETEGDFITPDYYIHNDGSFFDLHMKVVALLNNHIK